MRIYATIEASRQADDSLKKEYKNRLIAYIKNSLLEPYIHYEDESSDVYDHYVAVSSNDLYMNHTFTFHHHCPQDVLEYAIRRRGDAAWLVETMKDLRVDEYPFPFDQNDRRVYMVGQNGNHRSALYKAIGLPDIMLNRVSKIKSFNIDGYYIQQYNINLINLFKKVGLLQMDNGKYKDRFGYLIWILPKPSHNYERQIIDLCAKARWVNKVLNPNIPVKYKFLESEYQIIKELNEGLPSLAKFLNKNLLITKITLAKLRLGSDSLEKKRENNNDKIFKKLSHYFK